MLVAVLLFILSVSKQLDGIRSYLDNFTNRIFIFNNGADSIASHIQTTLIDVQALNSEHEDLRKRVTELEQKLSNYDALVRENQELNALLDNNNAIIARRFIVRVINTEQGIRNNIIYIDRGINSGIFLGQNIYDSDGLIGQVVSSSDSQSRVLLITDINSFVPVYNLQNQEQYVVKGTNSLDLEVQFVRAKSQVKEGDLLFTNNLGNRFIPNQPVAKITHVERDLDQSVVSVKAAPLAHIQSLRYIVATWPYCDFRDSPFEPVHPAQPGQLVNKVVTHNFNGLEATVDSNVSEEQKAFEQIASQDYRWNNCYIPDSNSTLTHTFQSYLKIQELPAQTEGSENLAPEQETPVLPETTSP